MASTSAAIQVIDFVRSLAMAWKNLAAYPRSHPAVAASLDSADRRLAELRGPAGDVTFGIGSDSLVYGSLTLDSAVAQKFAFALYARGVAVCRFGSETTREELDAFLRILATSTPGHEARPIWEEITAAGVVNINLQPVNYEAVQLTDELPDEPPGTESVWDEILRALLEGRRFAAGSEATSEAAGIDDLSRMLTEYVDAVEGPPLTLDDDATFGVRVIPRDERLSSICSFIEMTFGERIRNAPLRGLQHSLEQAAQLLRTLAAPIRTVVLAGIVRALAGHDVTVDTLREFAAALPNDDVLDALRYLSSVGSLSPHASSLLRSLTLAAPSAPSAATRATPAAVADLARLFGDDDADRFNPPEHRDLLASVAVTIPDISPEASKAVEELGARKDTVAGAIVERQLVTVLFDLLDDPTGGRPFAAALKKLEVLFRQHVERGDYEEASALLDRLNETASRGSEELRRAVTAHLGSAAGIPALVESLHASDPEKLPALQRIVLAFGAPALQQLLEALAEEGNLSRRRRLFDFIASLGPGIGPIASQFLTDARWYVVRNIIALLRVIEDRQSLPEVRKLGAHPDLRVRLEAIKSLLALDGNVPMNLLDDLFANADPKLAQGAVALVGSYKMKEGIDPLLRILEPTDYLGGARMIRIKAIRALGEIGDPRALRPLDRFFRKSWLPWPAREERLAAWESLASYPPQARKPFLEIGRKSRDANVRAICARLSKE
ncbi:MAG TPA: HEAT repeat domain-containing protein [Thermoanaerobaculia bacterium]|nr:HEAT repeat domain-containing protein [Thermoanaerobaculia bacterium]